MDKSDIKESKFLKFFLDNRFVLLISIVFVLYIVGNLFLGLDFQRQASIAYQEGSLQILANEKAMQITNFLDSQKEKHEILSSVGVLKEVVKDPSNPTKIEAAKKRIEELKSYYPGIGVLTKEGIIVVAENNPAGTDYSSMPYFPADDNSIITFLRYYDIQRKNDFYAVGGPIYDRIEKGKVIGIVSFDIELEKIGTLMKEAIGDETREVYLIDENGLLLSSSKYVGNGNKNGVLIQEIKSEGAKECLEDLEKYAKDGTIVEHEEKVIRYTNYIGNEVLGSHAYVPSIMGCVIAEENIEDNTTKFSLIDYIKNIFN